MTAVYVIVGLAVYGALTRPPTTPEPPVVELGGDSAGVWLVVLAAAAGAWAWGKARGGGRVASGRAVVRHAHGDRRTIAWHEAGHVVAARAVGGRGHSAVASDTEGLVQATVPDVRASVTFLRAGRYAAGTRRGCWGDEQAERAELRDVPRADRGQLVRDADRDARRIVRQHRGQIRRDAAALESRGRL